jgi:hypothetical protein
MDQNEKCCRFTWSYPVLAGVPWFFRNSPCNKLLFSPDKKLDNFILKRSFTTIIYRSICSSLSNTEHLDTCECYMESLIHFSFRNKSHSAAYVISDLVYPTYIYASLNSPDLLKEFGEDICIHTDGRSILTDRIYSDNRLTLYTAIFKAITEAEELKVNHQSENNF